MAEFAYKGRDGSGALVEGVLEAGDQNGAADALLQQGIMPITILPHKSGSGDFDLSRLLPVRVSLDELLIFSRQMYSLTKAGVPILRAMAGLAESTHSRHLREALLDVVHEMESGRTLSTAMSRHPKVFTQLFIALVHVGENTGHLDNAFLQLSRYIENEEDTRKRIKTALRYPSFVVIAIAIALVILNIWVIPVFADMFAKFNATLPLPTRILIGMSSFMLHYWWALLAALIAAGLGVRAYLNSKTGRWRWDRLRLRLWIVGDIIERSTLARFCRSFSIMLDAGVPLTHALTLVSEAVDNHYMADKILAMRQGIERGDSLLRTANSSTLFTPLVMQMIAVGEETGRIDELLIDAAEYYEREVDYDLKTLTARIEPIMIAVVAGMVLLLALGIFLPMWDMMSAIKGG